MSVFISSNFIDDICGTQPYLITYFTTHIVEVHINSCWTLEFYLFSNVLACLVVYCIIKAQFICKPATFFICATNSNNNSTTIQLGNLVNIKNNHWISMKMIRIIQSFRRVFKESMGPNFYHRGTALFIHDTLKHWPVCFKQLALKTVVNYIIHMFNNVGLLSHSHHSIKNIKQYFIHFSFRQILEPITD